MKLNDLNCDGYSLSGNMLKFSISKSSFDDICSIDDSVLKYTNDDGSLIASFGGYELDTIKRVLHADGSVSYYAYFQKQISDLTKNAIAALETNLENLKQVTQTSIMALATTTDPIPAMLMRANLSDNEAVEYISIYPSWQVGFDYKKGWIIQYDGSLYRIGQDHTSQAQWIPGETGTEALYSKIEIEDGYEVWKAWDGVSGSYSKNQIVKDPTDDQLYRSKIDSNVWGPPSEQPDYWELYVES